jgi:hypothetical protein
MSAVTAPGSPASGAATASGTSLAVTSLGSGEGACAGGGKRRNHTRMTAKLSAVARMRFLF